MLFRGVVFVLAFVSSLTISGIANAGISFPCVGETVVKVYEVNYPRVPQNRHVASLKEQNLHLGYVFKGCFKGEWIGYAGPDKRYVALTDRQTSAMLNLIGLDALPPAPSYWSNPDNYRTGVMWVIMALVLIIAAVLQQMGVLTPKKDEAENGAELTPLVAAAGGFQPVSPSQAMPPSFRSALTAVERAASEHGRVSIAGQLRAENGTSTAAPQSANFGKR